MMCTPRERAARRHLAVESPPARSPMLLSDSRLLLLDVSFVRVARGRRRLRKGRTHGGQERLGLNTNPDNEHDERREGHHLAEREVANWLVSPAGRLSERSEDGPLDEPQHVPGAEHDAEDGEHGDHLHLRRPDRMGACKRPLKRTDKEVTL